MNILIKKRLNFIFTLVGILMVVLGVVFKLLDIAGAFPMFLIFCSPLIFLIRHLLVGR